MDKKFDGKQKLLAEKMGKSEAEVSKWLNGVQNFTMKTLSKLSAAFGEPVIAVCTHGDMHSTFTLVKTSKPVSVKWVVDKEGRIAEEKMDIQHLNNLKLSNDLKKELPA